MGGVLTTPGPATQGALFAFDQAHGIERPTPETVSPRLHLDRVSEEIRGYILDFLRDVRTRAIPEFHMQELTEYVHARVTVAPDSPGRILRDLRQRGVVAYSVVARASSRYRVGE